MRAHSAVIYDGPSLINGVPIIAVAILGKSRNTKTGPMVQTYILARDMSPLAASKCGFDSCICGRCPYRGTPTTDPKRKQAKNRKCYVRIGNAPTGIWRKFARSGMGLAGYPYVLDDTRIAELGVGREVRLGAYGDPAAVPSHVWRALISKARMHTAYSHQAFEPTAEFCSDLYMQSANTLAEAKAAWSQHTRTFRVVADLSEIDCTNEILCPASKEAGYRTTCARCGLCGGNAGRLYGLKSVAIPAHGTGAQFIQIGSIQ